MKPKPISSGLRSIDWLRGTLAGIAFNVWAFVMLAASGNLWNSWTMHEYLEHPPVFEPLPADALYAGDAPYGPLTIDIFSPWESPIALFGLVAAVLMSGALAARIGPTVKPLRGAVAASLSCIGLLLVNAVWDVPAIAVLGLLAAGAGLLGGYVVRFFMRRTQRTNAS